MKFLKDINSPLTFILYLRKFYLYIEINIKTKKRSKNCIFEYNSKGISIVNTTVNAYQLVHVKDEKFFFYHLSQKIIFSVDI